VRKAATAILVLLLPLLLCANVLQVYRYRRLEETLIALEREQEELIEQNKRAILAISILSSPDRIGRIADEELDLELISPEDILRLVPSTEGAQ